MVLLTDQHVSIEVEVRQTQPLEKVRGDDWIGANVRSALIDLLHGFHHFRVEELEQRLCAAHDDVGIRRIALDTQPDDTSRLMD